MSETLYYDQLFDSFDVFEQVFQEFTEKSYTLWTTVSSALIKGTNNQSICIINAFITVLPTK